MTAVPFRPSTTVARHKRLMRAFFRQVGWMGTLAIGLGIACLGLYTIVIPAAEKQVAQSRAQAAALRQKVERASAPGPAKLQPAAQLVTFYAFFPQDDSVRPWLERIYAVAAREGLRLDEGEYRASRDQQGKLTRHQMLLPVRGTYPQIRRFLDSVLSDIPNVALEHVQFERKAVSDSTVQAKVKLIAFVGPRP